LIVNTTAIGYAYAVTKYTVKSGFIFRADTAVLPAKLEQLGGGTCS
jgi:hypothetical protein